MIFREAYQKYNPRAGERCQSIRRLFLFVPGVIEAPNPDSDENALNIGFLRIFDAQVLT